MSNKSLHLEKLIEHWKEESQLEFQHTERILSIKVGEFEKHWRWKKFWDNIYLPFTALIFLAILLSGEKVQLYFGIAPFTAIIYLIYLLRKKNLEVDQIDIAMDVCSFREKQLAIIENEVGLLRRSRVVLFPLLIPVNPVILGLNKGSLFFSQSHSKNFLSFNWQKTSIIQMSL
jgi:hypothetical protein